jgi:hypothetical protein
MNEAPRKTVTLEDLLRVKRSEQPSPEFWAEFERGLRTKQLAAIVEPRPWWAPLIRIGSRVARYQLPVGVTAILAFTLLTVREYGPVASTPVFEPSQVETASLPAPARSAVQVRAVDAATVPVVTGAVASVAVEEPAPAPVAAVVRKEPAPVQRSTSVGAMSHVAMVTPELSSARYIADNLASVQPTDSELDQLLGGMSGSALRASPQSEPLAQIALTAESRSQRLLAGMAWAAPATTTDSALRANEHTARHLSERRLSESDVISRLDVGGNRVTVKF